MTEEKQKTKVSFPVRADKLLLSFVIILLMGLFIKNAALAADHVRQALLLCARTVIPSIFPATVLSALFISLGGGNIIGKLCEKPMRLLFGISGAGATVLFLGWFCGFPVGAITGAELVRRGELSENEFSDLMLFANIPSPAFVISAVGDSMLKSHSAGIALYLTLLCVSVLTGILARPRKKRLNVSFSGSVAELSTARAIGTALASSAVSMLNICANIVFFSVLTKLILSILVGLIDSPLVAALICCVFELSGGCAEAAALGGKSAVTLCAFALGWSGLGVHFQIISASEKLKRLPLYIAVKFLQGLVCAAAAFVTA